MDFVGLIAVVGVVGSTVRAHGTLRRAAPAVLSSHGTLRRAAPAVLSASATAVLSIQCGDRFDERLQWLLSLTDDHNLAPLLRIEEIGPADAPRHALVAGAGVSLWLEAGNLPAQPLTLRLSGASGPPSPPEGCQVVAVEPEADLPRSQPLALALPPFRPYLTVSRQSDGPWGVGRAGMLYRDLLPDRAGGAVIVSHIRIPTGGTVPDYTHFHRVAFQQPFQIDKMHVR